MPQSITQELEPAAILIQQEVDEEQQSVEETKQEIAPTQRESTEEEKKVLTSEERQKVLSNKPVFRRYNTGGIETCEYGLQHDDQNVKIEIKNNGTWIIIDDRCYDTKTNLKALEEQPCLLEHKPRGWFISLGYKVPEGDGFFGGNYTLEVNGNAFTDMDEAPPRERAALARTAI